MSVSSIGANPASYTPIKPQTPPPQAAKTDADGDHDGTTAAKAADYKSGAAVDVQG